MLTNFYHNKSIDLFPNVDPQTGVQKVIQFPLIRLIIILIFLAPPYLIITVVRRTLIAYVDETSALYLGYFFDLVLIISLALVYYIYTSAVENRKAYEFSFNKFGWELGAGALLGFSIIAFFVALISLLGYYKIEEFNSFGNVVFMFFTQLKVGFLEELMFRVILFKLTEELIGSWSAIALQGILFGFAHAGNPNASIYSTFALILSFSIFFGAGYMMTRRIWFIMGFHWSWNFFQAGIFGMNNSGNSQPGLITPIIEGPVWLTGGEWGPELSLFSIAVLFTVSLYFVKIASYKNQFVKPLWRR